MLLPADSYIVINKSMITDLDKKVLVDLYQPIIGNKAVSLYFTLLNDLDKNQIMTEPFLHHHLLSMMQISLEEIKIAREKLEAIGLLKTYFKKSDNTNNYVYVLYSPLSSNEFFNHPILNIVLYNNVGKKEYEQIIQNYKVPKISLKDYCDVSSKFDEVFFSVATNSFFQNEDLISKNKNELKFKEEIDFELLYAGLNCSGISEKIFTKSNNLLVAQLDYNYARINKK